MRFIFLVSLSLVVFASVAHAFTGQCPSGDSFACPVCDGTVTIQVEDCLECDGFLQSDLTHDKCFNRRLFNIGAKRDDDSHYHYWWNDIVGAVIWFITAGIAISCGVGGGSVYVPMGMIVLQFAPKPASGLSQASIFGACVGGYILNCKNFHPETKIRHDPGVGELQPLQVEFKSKREEQEYLDRGGIFYTRPVINYSMGLFMLPLQIAGAVLGVMIQKLLPNWLYLLTAAGLLIMVCYLTFGKYRSTAAKEKAKRMEQAEQIEDDATPDSDPNEIDQSVQKSATQQEDPHLEARIEFLKEDMRQYPLESIAAAFALWSGLIVLNLMIGGRGMESVIGLDCESFTYNILVALQFVWLMSFAIFYGFKLLRSYNARKAVNYPFLHDDVVWSYSWLYFYGGFAFFGGAIGGLIGVGGALVLGPVLMITGIHPSVSTATTASMVVFTSSNIALMYVISGMVPKSYAIFYFFVCVVGALFGKSKIDAYVKRTGRASLLILILCGIITCSTVGCLSIALSSLANQDWCFDGFKKFCTVSSEAEVDHCSTAEDQLRFM
jgi:uncharacterized membrane protein YfcA